MEEQERHLVADASRSGPSRGTSVSAPDAQRAPAAAPAEIESKPMAQTALVVMATGAVLGLSLITNVVTTRGLVPAEKGLLTVGLQAAFIMSSLLLVGVDRSLPIVLSGEPMHRTIPLAWRAIRRRVTIAAPIALAATTLGLLVDLGAADIYFVLAGPVTLMALATNAEVLFRAASINSGQAGQIVVLATTAGVLILGSVVALTVGGIAAVPIWLVAYGVARGVVSLIFLRRGNRAADEARPAEPLRETVEQHFDELQSKGRRLWPASFANLAAFRADRFLLPLLTGETATLGVYVIIATFADLAAGPTEALANVMTPRWRRSALLGELTTMPILLLALGYLIVGVIGVAAFGPTLINWVSGAAYRPSNGLATVLAIASGTFGFNRLLAARAAALGATSTVSVAETLGMAVAVVGYVALIPVYGATGAALASLVGYGTTTIALQIAGQQAAAANLGAHEGISG